MRIDVHAHYFPSEYLRALDRLGSHLSASARNLLAGDEPGDLEGRFRMMDDAGIEMQILSVTPIVPYFAKEADAVKASRIANNQYAEIVSRYPKRFRAFAVTPFPHVDASLAELRRGLDELDMMGVVITTTVLGQSLASPQFEPFFAELDRRGAVLFVHPAGLGAGEQTNHFGLTWIVGAPFEDTLAVLHLILSGITTRYPNIKIIANHLGGPLPFLMQRIDNQYRPSGGAAIREKPSTLARRLWYDTIGHGHIPALRCAVETFGADRLMLGTDYPYLPGEQFKREVTYVQDAGLPAEAVRAILDGNAQRLLDIAS